MTHNMCYKEISNENDNNTSLFTDLNGQKPENYLKFWKQGGGKNLSFLADENEKVIQPH